MQFERLLRLVVSLLDLLVGISEHCVLVLSGDHLVPQIDYLLVRLLYGALEVRVLLLELAHAEEHVLVLSVLCLCLLLQLVDLLFKHEYLLVLLVHQVQLLVDWQTAGDSLGLGSAVACGDGRLYGLLLGVHLRGVVLGHAELVAVGGVEGRLNKHTVVSFLVHLLVIGVLDASRLLNYLLLLLIYIRLGS